MNARLRMARIECSGIVPKPKRSSRLRADLFTTAPRLWRARRHQHMRWIEGKAPDSEEAAAIREALLTCRDKTYGAITRYVADLLFRRDLAAGGYIADIGLFRSWYLLHACESLERLDGRLVWIESEAHPWS